jgi:hypothetical protein
MELLDGAARLVISTAETPLVVRSDAPDTVVAGDSLQLAYPVGGGAMPYVGGLEVGGRPTGVVARIEGDQLFLEGAALESGAFDLRVRITDARQIAATSTIPLAITLPVFADRDLMAGLVRGANLTATQRQLLDNEGNRNGRLDVGDLRAYLRR